MTKASRTPPPSTVRRLVNLTELAVLLGRDYKVIQEVIKEDGCPVSGSAGKGIARMVDVGEFVRWLESRAAMKALRREGDPDDGVDKVTREQVEIRKLTAQARSAEVRALREELAVAETELAEEVLRNILTKVKSAWESLETRIVADMPGDRRAKMDAAIVIRKSRRETMQKCMKITIRDVLEGKLLTEEEMDDTDPDGDLE